MLYATIAGYLAAALGGLILGFIFAPKLSTDTARATRWLEARVASIERGLASNDASASAKANVAHASALERHADAVAKLADSIQKHAAAVDDHGAAIVAAAVESHPETVSQPTSKV
jgi:hypothetical protein